MAEEREILVALIKHDMFQNEDAMVTGIAQKAIDNGFDNLSVRQKAVLEPFLTRQCPGIFDPGDHHNNCQNILEGGELVAAINQSGYYGEIICRDCRDEKDGYTREWERIEAE